MKHYASNLSIIAVSILCLGSITAHASGPWEWATESAIAQFTPEDFDLLKAAARDVLNNQPDQKEISWNNPGTGHSGSITVLGTTEMNGQTCRDTLLKNDAKTVKGTSQYLLCQQADDTWKITVSN